jgi:hypothetical protein
MHLTVLNTERMDEEIQEYQMKWHNHVERMLPERLPWQTYSYHPTGKRDIGRPRRRWRLPLASERVNGLIP